MKNVLNFRNVKKTFLTVTLADAEISETGVDTVLFIGMPTKAIMDDVTALHEALDTVREDENNAEALEDLYAACAKAMSRNKNRVRITPEYLAEIFDVEDVIIFFNAYVDFVRTIEQEKN